MALFASYSDILPSPLEPIGLGGQSLVGGYLGPGFTRVNLASIEPMLQSKTPSGTSDTKNMTYHRWVISISYNALTKQEFHTLFTFILQYKVSLEPFYVYLPQFAGQADMGASTVGPTTKADTIVETYTTGTWVSGTIISMNEKVYKVVSIETPTDYIVDLAAPPIGQVRLHISPAIQTTDYFSIPITTSDVKFRVQTSGDALAYTINDKGLYNVSLNLEEIV